MQQFSEFLTYMQAKYPAAEITDYVKFLYQSAFGAGHFVQGEQSLASLLQEWGSATQNYAPLQEKLLGGGCRVYIGAAKAAGLTPGTLAALFATGAAPPLIEKNCNLQACEAKANGERTTGNGGIPASGGCANFYSANTHKTRVASQVAEDGPNGIKAGVLQAAPVAETTGASGMGAFTNWLQMLEEAAAAGQLPFSSGALAHYLAAYKAEGYPPVSHSEAYKNAYAPHYRVLNAAASLYLPLFIYIDKQLAGTSSKSEDKQVLLAVEGMCGAGKTSLAALLQSVYGCPVLHIDDFFLQPHQRTPARLAEIGGNLDYERFAKEVATPFAANGKIEYRPFNCETMAFEAPVTVKKVALVVVEGSYSTNPALLMPYTCKVFLSLPAAMQSARILARSGPALHRRFIEEWIPKENAFFEKFETEKSSDFVFSTEGL